MVGVTSCTHQKEKLLQKHSKNLGESLLRCFKKIFPLRDLTCLVSKLRTLNYCVIWLQSVNTLGSVKKTNSYLMFIISGYRNIAGSLYMTFGFARTAAAPVLLGTTQHNAAQRIFNSCAREVMCLLREHFCLQHCHYRTVDWNGKFSFFRRCQSYDVTIINTVICNKLISLTAYMVLPEIIFTLLA